jgi:hypothetical protein
VSRGHESTPWTRRRDQSAGKGRTAGQILLDVDTAAVAADLPSGRVDMAADMARTLLSTARGIKHEATTREEFVARMTIGVDLFLPALN